MNNRKLIICVVLCAFFATSVTAPAMAKVIPTETMVGSLDRAAHLEKVDAVLMRADVREQLTTMGVDAEQARQRAAALSDQELAKLAEQIDSLPAGGDSVLAVVGVVFIVLLILELTGVVNIFRNI